MITIHILREQLEGSTLKSRAQSIGLRVLMTNKNNNKTS